MRVWVLSQSQFAVELSLQFLPVGQREVGRSCRCPVDGRRGGGVVLGRTRRSRRCPRPEWVALPATRRRSDGSGSGTPPVRDRIPPRGRRDQEVGPRHSAVDPVLSPHLVGVAAVVVVPPELKPATRAELQGSVSVIVVVRTLRQARVSADRTGVGHPILLGSKYALPRPERQRLGCRFRGAGTVEGEVVPAGSVHGDSALRDGAGVVVEYDSGVVCCVDRCVAGGMDR